MKKSVPFLCSKQILSPKVSYFCVRMNAIITGASKGVGRAVSIKLASLSYDVFLIARSKSDLEQVSAEIKAFYPKVRVKIFTADLSDDQETIRVGNQLLAELDSVDVLVNNVGSYSEDTIFTARKEDIRTSMNVNFFSAFTLWNTIGHAVPENGVVINICSILSKNIRRTAFSYTLSKQMLYTFGKFLQTDLMPKGIRVTNVIPGSINTTSWDGINAPKEMFVQPEDIAAAIEVIIKSTGWFEEFVVRPIHTDY